MTTSAIRFHDKSIDVRDPDLRELLKAIAFHLPAYARENAATTDWLVEACAGWLDAHEASPPGLRDLELDEALTTPERLTGMAEYLTWLTQLARPGDAYDAPVARRVIASVLMEVLSG